MSYASILVHVTAGKTGAPQLGLARAMAERFDATLIGVGAEMVPPLVPDSGYYSFQGDWFTIMRGDIENNLKSAKAAFDAAGAGLSKPTLWEAGIQYPTGAVARASRAADLIIADARGSTSDVYRQVDPAELAITSGRPVLVAPRRGEALEARRVVLAWKDTREARRALSDAMPFFEKAERVLVLEVCDQAEAEDAGIRTSDVAEALGRHGVTAEAKVAVHKHPDGHEILRQASVFGADLVVAGAYGHTRVGEWVFGGVTRDLLVQDDIHVLLSH
jgi:nucleotide-binding universal stress UspA family protein